MECTLNLGRNKQTAGSQNGDPAVSSALNSTVNVVSSAADVMTSRLSFLAFKLIVVNFDNIFKESEDDTLLIVVHFGNRFWQRAELFKHVTRYYEIDITLRFQKSLRRLVGCCERGLR